jgi:histone H3/H4
MPDIPLSSIDRIIRYSGASRIKPDATEKLRNLTENLCLTVAKKAFELTRHRSQQTITEEDIRQAFRLLFNNLHEFQ